LVTESQDLFVRDIARSYEDQLVGFDMEDVDAILRSVTSPRLGFGFAHGAERATEAAAAALRQVGGAGSHSLMIVSVRANEGRLQEFKWAMNVVRDKAPLNAFVIFGARIDPDLPAGVLRVSLLTG
jgi:cell division GTPase FtsZ